MAVTTTPAQTSRTRVFVIEGRARGDHKPSYQSRFRMMGLSQNFGDVTKIEEPDPDNYGKFVEVGSIRGAEERVTTSLEGRYALSLLSMLARLAKEKCAIDVQLHLGECTDPSDFNEFQKALVLEQAYLTTYNTDEMGALESGGDAAINENVDISAREFYEVVKLSFGSKAGSLVTNEIVDATLCDSASCGDCEEESDGCQKIFAVTVAAGGSPSTPADVVFSLDKGTIWYAHDVDTLDPAEDASGIACIGSYVVVVSNASGSLHYALRSEFDGETDPTFTEITTGIVAGGEPNAIYSLGSVAFVVGDGGYIYKTEDVTSGVEVLDAGVAVTAGLNDVHALSEEFIVAVGNGGVVVYSENGTTFSVATSPTGAGANINCVFVKSESEWWVGASNGYMYYTLDGGDTWSRKDFAGAGAGQVRDIQFATDSVGYMSHDTASPAGRIFRSYDGGYSWQTTPEATGQSIPANDRMNALVACDMDPNFVVGVGLADDGSDGYIAVGIGS